MHAYLNKEKAASNASQVLIILIRDGSLQQNEFKSPIFGTAYNRFDYNHRTTEIFYYYFLFSVMLVQSSKAVVKLKEPEIIEAFGGILFFTKNRIINEKNKAKSRLQTSLRILAIAPPPNN
jgi:hypothetical protein